MAPVDIQPDTLRERIKQLKSKIGDLISVNSKYDDDLYLLVWLRASKFDVEQVESKIRNYQKWRDEFTNTDGYVVDTEAANHYGFLKCKARDDRVVIVGNTRKIDLVKMFNEVSEERQERFLLNHVQELELEMIESNRRNFDGQLTVNSARGIIAVAEVGSVPFRAIMNPRIAAFYYRLFRKLATYFPGAFETMIWINAPSGLGVVLQTCGKFLSGPFFRMQSVSGPAEVEQKVYSIISPEALKDYI